MRKAVSWSPKLWPEEGGSADKFNLYIYITKGSLGYLSSMYFSTSLVLGEVGAPFPEIESRESRTET